MNSTFAQKLAELETKMTASADTTPGYYSWEDVRDAATSVTDSIGLSWAAAQSIFGDKATPEIALRIYDLMVEHMDMVIQSEEDDEDLDGEE